MPTRPISHHRKKLCNTWFVKHKKSGNSTNEIVDPETLRERVQTIIIIQHRRVNGSLKS